jgi:adenine deaminase
MNKNSCYFVLTPEKSRELQGVALGKVPADIAIINCELVNVYTGEILPETTILIKGDTIAYTGKTHKAAGLAKQVINAAGKTVIPGFIDGHTHIDDTFRASEVARYALLGNTTTIITETSAIGSAMGYRGVVEYMKSLRDQPVRFFITIPPVITISSAINQFSQLSSAQLDRLLKLDEVLALGEISWAQLNDSMPRLYEYISESVKSGKYVDGHSAGARGEKLQAYFATGISSCHEPITSDELLERLRLGIFVPVREGAVRHDLKEVSKIKDSDIDFRGLAVSSDGIDPRQLVHHGYMDFIVQKAIDYGIKPVLAVQMASINVAQHYGLSFLGGIAPGKLADMAIVPNLKTIKPECVIAGGKVVVEKSKLLVEPRKHVFPASMYKTVKIKHDYSAEDFVIHATGNNVNVRVINLVSRILARELVKKMNINHGTLTTDIENDILKVAVIARYWEPGKTGLGFIKGVGIKSGAIATSTCWDGGQIAVVGCSDSDIAFAVNWITKNQGGTVVVREGRVLAELPLPVGGLFSDLPIEQIAGKFDEIQKAAEDLGTSLPGIYMSLQVLTTPSIPFLRISEDGLFDLKQNKVVDLIIKD